MENKIITIDGVEYSTEDMSDMAKLIINHITKVNQKLEDLAFDADELKVARTGFINMLKSELTSEKTETK